jgi:Ca2+:H+ antiporter
VQQHGFKAGFRSVTEALGLSKLSFLLFLVPPAFATHAAHIDDQNIIFVLNALAILPLTGILTRSTENISDRIGVALGALVNITSGNAVELIML